ncbi:hypothetical protein [Candidatus Uabimicrobium sp. HlEnr_7]|uniref:hypothetical protein n=1 Tax=Candidatus Uabimicrobium helgolandensis TaxID=3095367 RepID=UPI0035563522
MATIKCKRCGKKHSSAASCCLHCGYPKKQNKAKKVIKPKIKSKGEDNTIRNLFSALVLLLLIAFVAQAVRESTSTNSNSSNSSQQNTIISTNNTPIKKIPTQNYNSNAFQPLVEYVQNQMERPESFQHVSTTKEKIGNSYSISMVYRERSVAGTLFTKKVKAYVTSDNRILSVEFE